ncbi:MAG: PfkB family carbohydrate kinase [Shimia sp.]
MSRLVFVGEALIDFITEDGATYAANPGGSPYSASKAAARAGGRAFFAGAVSTDLFGRQIMEDLAAHGVDTALAPRSDDPTVLGFIQVKPGEHPAYAFFDRGSAMVNMDPALPDGALAAGDVLGIGSISLIPSPGADRIADFALTACAETGAALALDPNVRPGMIAGHPAWRGRMDRLMGAAHLVKASTEDLEFYTEGVSAEAFARARLAEAARLVIVTDGENGARGWSRAGEAAVAVSPATGGDTVGAGDTLLGYVLTRLAEIGATGVEAMGALGPDALEDVLRLGCTAAAMNCAEVGCRPPERAAVEAVLAANH